MPKIAGRKVRWKYSSDGGTTYTAVAGSTSDGLTFNAEGIDVTDKDDDAWRTMLDDIGVRSVDGTITMYITNVTLWALVLDSPSSYLHDFQVEIEGLFTVTGSFFISSIGATGNEGAEGATQEVSVMSSGALTYAAA